MLLYWDLNVGSQLAKKKRTGRQNINKDERNSVTITAPLDEDWAKRDWRVDRRSK